MGIYEQLQDTVLYGDEVDLSHVLARLPSPPSESCAPALLNVFKRVGPEIASVAADHLASMPHGVGMVFLMEALTEPGIMGVTHIVELLNVRTLGTGWGRLSKVLANLSSKHRQQLLRKLMDGARYVPARRWKNVVLALQSGDEIATLLAGFAAITARVDHDESPTAAVTRGVEQAMSRALLTRLRAGVDSYDIQQKIVPLLVAVVSRHPFIARALVKMLAQDGICQRNRAVLTELVKHPGVITMAHATTAVGSLVGLVGCGDQELAAAARAALAGIPGAGAPADWMPLLDSSDPDDEELAYRSLAVHRGDVSVVLLHLLAQPRLEDRRRAVRLLNARLVNGCVSDADAWPSYARIIAFDESQVAEAFDVGQLLVRPGEILRFFACIEFLATPHTRLLQRTVEHLHNPEVWHDITSIAHHAQFAAALSEALLRLPPAAPAELVRGVANLLGQLPSAPVVQQLDRDLCHFGLASVERAVRALRQVGDAKWNEACENFLDIREDGAQAKRLHHLHDPRRAWVARAALDAREREARLHGLRALRRLANPELVHAIAPLLQDEHPSVRVQAARALDTMRHPDAFVRLQEAARETNDPVCLRACARLTTRLTVDEAEPFSWPPLPAEQPEVTFFELWSRASALHVRRIGFWKRFIGRPESISPLGRLVFSEQALWQRYGKVDEVVLWKKATLRARRDSMETAGRVGLVLQLEEPRSRGVVSVGCKLWVRLSERVMRLPVCSEDTLPWIHYTDRTAFFTTLGWYVRTYCEQATAEVIHALMDESS